jgi:predicted transcriptional regulator
MAEPKLQVDQRLDRHEKAISTMAQWLVQAQTGFNANDAEGIEKILRGEKPTEEPEEANA